MVASLGATALIGFGTLVTSIVDADIAETRARGEGANIASADIASCIPTPQDVVQRTLLTDELLVGSLLEDCLTTNLGAQFGSACWTKEDADQQSTLLDANVWTCRENLDPVQFLTLPAIHMSKMSERDW